MSSNECQSSKLQLPSVILLILVSNQRTFFLNLSLVCIGRHFTPPPLPLLDGLRTLERAVGYTELIQHEKKLSKGIRGA